MPQSGSEAGSSRRAVLVLGVGAGLAVGVLLLGVIAKTGPLARFDLQVDQHIAAHDRTGMLTTVAKLATTIATPEIVGVALMIVMPLVLWLLRRRIQAVKVFCMFGGAFALAEVGKKLIGEHRPPMSLWAMRADSSPSYPSGHATTAAVLAVAIVVIAGTLAWRYTAIVVGAAYALLVAVSRVYLADHYPADVVGGMLCALAAGFIVTGLAGLPVVRPYLRRLGT